MPLPPPPGATISSLPPPPPRPDHARQRWGLGDAVLSLGLYLLAAVAVAVVFAVSGGDADSLGGPWLPLFVLLPQVALTGYVVLAVTVKGRGVVADLKVSFEWRDLLLGAGLALGGLVAAGIVGAAVTAVFGEDQSAAVAELLEDSQDGEGLSIWIVLVAVVGIAVVPITEELAFRGLWWSALLKRGHSARLALIVSSLAFAAFHLEPIRLPVLFVLGLALGWGRFATGRLGASIVAHALINALAFGSLLIELS